MINKLEGIFIIKRGLGNNTIDLIDKLSNSKKVIDYFEFVPLVHRYFDLEKAAKILEYLNCGEKVLIDFNKSVAKLIVEKEFDFNNVLKSQMNSKNIENILVDINYFGDTTEIGNFKQL